MVDLATLKLAMAAVLFLLGVICFVAGLRVIFTREYREASKELATQSARIGRRGVSEHNVAPIIDATSRLLDAVSQLVRTAFGMGAFLCLLGVALCLISIWIIGWSL